MQMVATGWISEEPGAGPALPVTNLMLSMRQRGPGDALEAARARSRADEAREAREEAAAARDPDEHAVNLVTRGYAPGMISQLSRQIADTEAELADEEAKLEKAARRQEWAMREHAAGRVDVFRMQAMMDGDDGDEGRVRLLERRAESLRRQMAEAQQMMAPPQRRDLGGVEAASRHAHQVFAEVTRSRLAEAEARRPERRPFASASRGAGRSTEHTGPDCRVCAEGRRAEAARRGEVVGVPFRSALGSGEMVRAVEGGIVSIR
jgi:hypothetical protein